MRLGIRPSCHGLLPLQRLVLAEAVDQRIDKARQLRRRLQRGHDEVGVARQLNEAIDDAGDPDEDVGEGEQGQEQPVARVVVEVAALHDADARLDAEALLRRRLGLLGVGEPRAAGAVRGAGARDGLAHEGGLRGARLAAHELVVHHAHVDGGGGRRVHAEGVGAVQRGAAVALAEAAADVDKDGAVAGHDDEEDGVAPAVAEGVAQVGWVARDPAPVARDGLDLVEEEGEAGGRDGEEPDEADDEALLAEGAVDDPLVEADRQERDDGDAEDREVGGLDRDLADPAVEVAGRAVGQPFLGGDHDVARDGVVPRVDEFWRVGGFVLVDTDIHAARVSSDQR